MKLKAKTKVGVVETLLLKDYYGDVFVKYIGKIISYNDDGTVLVGVSEEHFPEIVVKKRWNLEAHGLTVSNEKVKQEKSRKYKPVKEMTFPANHVFDLKNEDNYINIIQNLNRWQRYVNDALRELTESSACARVIIDTSDDDN